MTAPRSPSRDAYDVVVVGGGPAGATAAALIAAAGRSVLLLEKAAEPRFKVGESLMPATWWTLERLGVIERMAESAFPAKYSVQFFASDGRPSAPFYFFETDDHESSRTWQVLRADFDRLLLDNAAEKGVEVVYGAAVSEVLFESGDDGGSRAVGVRASFSGGRASGDGSGDGGARRDIAARVVVDATGQSALIARSLGLKKINPRLRHASYFTHFEGARRDRGIDEGATLILHTESKDCWFWFIPLPDDRASVGVVGPVEKLVANGDPQAVFDEQLERCPAVAERLTAARQARQVQVAKDFSYLATRVAGDGWVLAGDALGFLDPIYSSGVFLALKSGEMAADAVVSALAADDPSAERLGAFADEYLKGMKAIRELVYSFYDPEFSFARFLRRFPEAREPVVDLLTGNVFRKPVAPLLDALEAYRTATAEPSASAAG